MIRRLAALACSLLALCSRAELRIVVDAGEFDRRDTVVDFAWPRDAAPTAVLEDDRGKTAAVQIEDGNATLVVRDLKRGERRTYKPGTGSVQHVAHANVSKDAVTLTTFGKTALVYHTAKTDFPVNRPDLTPIYHRAGYIHPVYTPSGLLVTDDYPRNHKHHHGIWLSWSHALFEGRTNDYWNMGEGKGTMEFLGLDKSWSGPVHAGFASRHQHVDLTDGRPKPALNETWHVRLFAVGNAAAKAYFLFDLDVTDSCATATPVQLPQYRYGGVCVRGNWAWNGKANASVLTSEGETDRAKGDKDQVHARWVHLGGIVQGKFAGIAALGNPQNFRAPEPVRLNAAEPYFNFTPQQAGDMEIAPGKPFVGRYRFVVADGAPDRAELDSIWNDYAHPPRVTVTP